MNHNDHAKKHLMPTFSPRADNKYRCNQNKKDLVPKSRLKAYKAIFWADGAKAASKYLENMKSNPPEGKGKSKKKKSTSRYSRKSR